VKKTITVPHRFIPSKLLQWLLTFLLKPNEQSLMSAVSILGQEFADYTSPFCITQNKMHSLNKKSPCGLMGYIKLILNTVTTL